ncbi:hypothetical protein BKA58DRAFT_465513 [Alternaria rosae]|uniref:uncharacterized protein n=1 Tax=Alternaria rosae TaxID=1187941 RepID=UPI001E8D35B0|nr:uncharacterized protein BKA58DRAFT_465513 [Alternaria rosae]KAH6877753.1 hypothetical protein BKA58DRAFT_465513 [Alternaria rosae]
MTKSPLYVFIAFFSVLAAAQEVPPGVSSLGGINPTVYSSAASVLSASTASDASAEATSTGAANAHEVKYAALFGVGGAVLNAFM